MDVHHDKLKNIPLRTKFRLKNFEGKNLYDLVEYGSALHELSCEVVYHLRNEVQRVLEYPVLIAVDDYNSLYNYNQTFREPETERFKPRKLLNRNLTLTRAFIDLHKENNMANGVFIGALSGEITYRHFGPLQDSEHCEWYNIPPYSLEETLKVMEHYKRTQFIMNELNLGTTEVIHQLCSGRGKDIFKYALSL